MQFDSLSASTESCENFHSSIPSQVKCTLLSLFKLCSTTSEKTSSKRHLSANDVKQVSLNLNFLTFS